MRLHRWVTGVLAGLIALTGASLSYAQEERRETEKRVERRDDRDERRSENGARNGQSEGRAPQARRAKLILGSKVSIRGDIAIGTVDDIVFGDDGYIDYLVVLNEGKYVTV